jgi:hypothetical protein
VLHCHLAHQQPTEIRVQIEADIIAITGHSRCGTRMFPEPPNQPLPAVITLSVRGTERLSGRITWARAARDHTKKLVIPSPRLVAAARKIWSLL